MAAGQWRVWLAGITLAATVVSTSSGWAQGKPENQGSGNALALEIVSAWQGSSRGATPQERAAMIEKALSLALRADPWPFRDPPRDQLLGQMWGQLGNERRRIEGPQRSAAMEAALDAYVEALKYVRKDRPGDWVRVQYGLGTVMVERIAGERGDNIEKAIAAFEAAGEIATRVSAPGQWASLQISLAKAYWHRQVGSRADNIESALQRAEAALGVIDRNKDPGDWSGALQALGAAYWGRIKGSRADNIEKALAAYEQAMSVTTEQRAPRAWAGIQDNIGMAYAERVRGEPAENVAKAAAAFEAAGRVFTREREPYDWAQLNMNFANLLLDATAGGSPAERINRAIGHYQAALTVYTPQQFPERHARVALNLGNALVRREQGDPAENVEQAIAAYGEALKFYAPDREPLKWSYAQSGLALALARRAKGDSASNLDAAIRAHDAALSVQTADAFPQFNLRSATAAGITASRRGDWAAASRYFDQAIGSSVRLFGQGLNAAEARLVIQEGERLFAGAAYAALRQGKPDEALAFVEGGKARLLRVSLGLDALALPGEVRQRLDALRGYIGEAELRAEQTSGDERRFGIERLEKLRREVVHIVEEAGSPHATSSDGTGRMLDRLLAHYAAVATPVVAEAGGALLIASRNVKKVQAIDLQKLDEAAMRRLLLGTEPATALGGWLGAYQVNSLPEAEQTRRQTEWLAAIAGVGHSLGDVVGKALATVLPDKAPIASDVLWIPQGGLGLLPMALAAVDDKQALLDRMALTVAPSLAVAVASLDRTQKSSAAPSLALIANPTGDLRSTEAEAAVAATYFKPASRRLDAMDATRATVLSALSKASYWHFATHGTFSWTRPRDSALLLAGGERLTMGDLLDHPGRGSPRLVVLSACETGLFDVQRSPDEFSGLPSAFLQAGAAGVVASLWPVDDASTALLMMRFYDRHLGGTMPPAQALREAQLWLRDATRLEIAKYVAHMSAMGRLPAQQAATLATQVPPGADGDRPFRHPFHWAAFQFYGG